MLPPPMYVSRNLPRSRPGTGPTSTNDATLRAELAQMNAEVARLVKEQQVQLRRIADIQAELDEVKRLLRALVKDRPR